MQSLSLLGIPSLVGEGNQEHVALNTPTSLLLYLAVKGDWVSRSELAFLYKPDETETEALKYLRLQLHRAQQYPWAHGLEIEKHQLRWLIKCDVLSFRQALKEQNWLEAVELYKDSFFARHSFKDLATYSAWIDLERESLEQSYRQALDKQLEHYEQQSDFEGAAALSAKLLALDELNEEVLQQHLRYLALSGQKESALKRFASFSNLLLEELDSEPSEETLSLIEQIRNDKAIELKTAREVKHNLPGQSTSFIGRKRELLELKDQLSKPEYRLLSLIGLGGSGKTRLGIEVARSQISNFKDGVYLIELAALESEDALLSHLAQVLGLQLSPKDPPKIQILNVLRNKQSLLVFDNFEHLLPLAPLLNDILAISEKIKLIVTSRENLKLKSETIYDVEGLQYPQEVHFSVENTLEDNEAVSLFLSAARRVVPQLEPNPEDLINIAQIAKQVEGLPLALELAASWVRIMPIARIAQELSEGYDLLEAELSDIPERHRNLKSILDKTWDALSEKKRQTLAKLSVFVGGCTLEAAEQVTGTHFSILLALVNASVLRRKSERFDFHEVIRQYILAKATDSSLLLETKQKHLRYYAKLAQDGNQNLNGKDQLVWFTKLRSDYENLIAALEWSLEYLPESAITLATELGNYWQGKSLLKEGEKWLEKTLPLAQQCTAEIQAKLYLKYLNMTIMQANYQKSNLISPVVLELCQKSQNLSLQASYYSLLGALKSKQGQFEEARDLFMQGLDFSEKAQDEVTKSYIFLNLGYLYSVFQDVEMSLKFQHKSLVLAEKRSDLRLEMLIKANLAYNKILQSDYEASIDFSLHADVLAQQIDERRTRGIIKGNLGYAYWQLGHYQMGEKYYREHLILLYEQGVMDNFIDNLFELSRFWINLKFDRQAQILWAVAEHLRIDYDHRTFHEHETIKQQVLGNLSPEQLEASASRYKHTLLSALQTGPEKAFL